MGKKEFRELMDKEDKTLINFNPELNQSGIYDNEGNRLKKAKTEQFSSIPMGFISSGIILILPGKYALTLYHYLSSKCDKWRNTQVTNETIIKDTGLSERTIKDGLRVLEFYHLINRRRYYIRPNRKRRIITLLRWDTAYKKLIEEGKIKAFSADDVYHINPYKKGLPV
jgi:hypothetical protein